MNKIIIYTDFDGTVTRRPGGDLVFTNFYQSLLQGYKENVKQDYKRTSMKTPCEIQSLFEAKFGQYDKSFDCSQVDVDLLMSPDAILFFHEILLNDDVTVNIVTKNRSEYINAVFKYHGFSNEEIRKLTILDSGNKFRDVNSQLKRQNRETVNCVYILDDSERDYQEMFRAVKTNHYDEIRGYNKKPGEFEWIQYLRDIRAVTSLEADFKDGNTIMETTSHQLEVNNAENGETIDSADGEGKKGGIKRKHEDNGATAKDLPTSYKKRCIRPFFDSQPEDYAAKEPHLGDVSSTMNPPSV